jgi:hypothetical protein
MAGGKSYGGYSIGGAGPRSDSRITGSEKAGRVCWQCIHTESVPKAPRIGTIDDVFNPTSFARRSRICHYWRWIWYGPCKSSKSSVYYEFTTKFARFISLIGNCFDLGS